MPEEPRKVQQKGAYRATRSLAQARDVVEVSSLRRVLPGSAQAPAPLATSLPVAENVICLGGQHG
jgi:hypothetical protein